MPEVTKIGYFLTDLIKKVDFFGDTVYMQPYNLCGELYSRMQCGTRLSQKKSRHSTTLNVELGSSSNTRPATQVRLSGGGTPDPRHRSDGGTPDPLHRSGLRRTSRRRRSTRRDDLDRCRATDIRDPPLSHTSSSHHPSLVDPRDGIVL